MLGLDISGAFPRVSRRKLLSLLDNQEVSALSGPLTMTFAFVDDTCIMVRSNPPDKNCEKIAKVHDLLNSWAQENGISFVPEKYGLLHSLPPGTKSGSVKCVPSIDNLPPAEKRKDI